MARAVIGLLIHASCAVVMAICVSPAVAREEPLEDRLAQAWRWRELELPDEAGMLVGVAGTPGRELIALFSEGVFRFDGHGWKSIVERSELHTGAPFGAVHELEGGLLIFDEGTLVTIDSRGIRRKLPEGGTASALRHSWTTGAGPMIWNGKVVLPGLDSFVELGTAPAGRVLSIERDPAGTLWASTKSGPMRNDGSGWTPLAIDPEAGLPLQFATVRADGEGRVWFLPDTSTPHHAIYCVPRGGSRAVRVEGIFGPVWDVVTVPGGGLVAGVGSGNLSVMRDGRWCALDLPVGLRGQVRGLARVGDGHLACRTLSGRLLVCDFASRRWRRHAPESEENYCNVLSLSPSRRGGCWVGTSKGVHYFDGERFQEAFTEAAGVPLRIVTAVHEDEQGHLWVGSGSGFGGILRYDGRTWEHLTEPHGVGRFAVHSIRRGRPGEIWFLLLSAPATDSAPLAGGALLWSNGSWQRFTTEDGLPSARCYDIVTAPDGEQFVGTLSGIARRTAQGFETLPDWSEVQVKSLHLASDGTLWAGHGRQSRRVTRSGNRRIHGERIADFTAAADIEEGPQGRIWMATNHGLKVFHGGSVHDLTLEPGLPARVFWPILREPGGGFWIGSAGKGLIHYIPDDLRAPRTVAANVRFDEEHAGPLLHWRGADYWNVTPQALLRFRWRVDGGRWSQPAAATEMVLDGLGSGAHTFEVQAVDLLGNVESEPVSVEFRVAPPWWASLEFVVPLLLALATAAAAMLVVRRQARVRRESQKGAERYARDLVEHARVILASFGPRGELRYLSPRFEQFTGRGRDSFHDRPSRFLRLVHPEDREAARSCFEVTSVAAARSAEMRVRHRDGDWRWFLVTLAARAPGEGAGRGFEFVGVDITALKHAEEERTRLERQFQHSQRLESLGLLAGGIAHDFNNLLAAIMGNASIALDELDPGSPTARALHSIENAAVRASELTNQMLAYSGRARFRTTTFNLSGLVCEMAHLLQSAISRDADLCYEIDRDVVSVRGDQAQVQQVAMNLITNASDALEGRPGTITVATGVVEASAAYLADLAVEGEPEAGPYAFMEVRDSGKGMEPDTAHRMFDPFFTTKFTGRGLGLAAVRGIVRGHDGGIKVSSVPGRGTVVRVLLPLASDEGPAQAAAAESVGELPQSSGRVLVVDDDAAVRDVARLILERGGLEVETATDGLSALEIFGAASERFDLVLLDMTMPRLRGDQCFRELRKLKDDVRVILMSGFDEQDVAGELRKEGLSGFLQKPFLPQQLLALVQEALGGGSKK